jgi:hypothetical protein
VTLQISFTEEIIFNHISRAFDWHNPVSIAWNIWYE